MRDLKRLVKQSYKGDELDKETVEFIAERLSRHELKEYVRLLKLEENKKQVLVRVPKKLSAQEAGQIEKMYPGKRITYTIDETMIGGIKITTNNVEYEVSMNQILYDIMTYLSNYDR